MKRHLATRALFLLVVLSFALAGVPPAAAAPVVTPGAPLAIDVFINEIHYDNSGTDSGEAIEIAGPAGTDLTGWKIIRYNGNGGAVYTTPAANPSGSDTLSGSIPNNCGGYGVMVVQYQVDGLQNGSPDGIALVTNTNAVVQFLSYEGSFAAVGGAANGMTSVDIGVSETSTTPIGQSLQLKGTGIYYEDFAWNAPSTSSFGSCNTGQTFQAPVDTSPTVAGTNPINGATGVAVNAAVSVTFSEGVIFSGPVSIVCTSGTQAVTPAATANPAIWNLPHTDFAPGDSCSITIPANQVADTDTNDPPDNMAADYTAWSFTVDAAPSVTGTSPANGATGVAVGDDLSVTFSEPVTIANIDSFFDIFCDSVPQSGTGSGGPTTFTINPTADLPAGSICTVTIKAAEVADQDTNDPPNTMTADHVFSFTTAVADSAPAVSATVPANGATGVAVGANLSVTFSEPVDVTDIDSFFDIYCVVSSVPTLQPAAGSGGPTTFTIDPAVDLPAGSLCTITIYAAAVTDQDTNDPPNNMAADYTTWSFTVEEPVVVEFIINEVDADTPGTDVAEFIELYDGGAGNTALDGLVVVLYNGNGDVSYGAFDLDGRATDAAGYFVICGNAANVANCDWDVTPDQDLVQNGADAVALYTANATNFPNGTGVTTSNLVDAIAYDTSDADDPGLLVLLNAGQPQVDENSNNNGANESNQRCPNGSGGQRNTSTYLQRTPTAGVTNNCPVDVPPQVSSTVPTSGATGVSTGTTITLNFSEPVDLAAGAATLECPVGTPIGFTSPIPVTNVSAVTLTPSAPLPAATLCAVTAVAANITDRGANAYQLDGNNDGTGGDNYSFTFTTAAVDPCTLPATLISAVQGSGPASPYLGSSVTIQGVVIGDYEDSSLKGYFVQEEDADSDGNSATSEGVFVYDNNNTDEVSLGNKVRVTGTVVEYVATGYSLSLTEISTSAAPTICSSGNSVTAAVMDLPAASGTDLERYEGMKVAMQDVLTVTDNYDLGRYGQLTLSENGKLWQFTHLYPPSVSGYASYLNTLALRSIILDDGSTIQNPDPIRYPGTGLTALNTVRVGDTLPAGFTAVLDHRYDLYRLQPIGQVDFTASNPRGAVPAVGGNVQVGAFNTLNFFVTTGSSAICGPSGTMGCRGATNATEFTRQRDKLVAAICGLDADVLGLMELENPYSGNDPAPGDGVSDYVLQNLVGALNASSACPDDYAFLDNTAAGTDAIRQGIIYKPTVVTPAGTTANLNTTAFINGGDGSARNRPALTQAFEVIDGGERFIVTVNHLKSKGSACDDPDILDGQANCAIVRTNAAIELSSWLATSNPTGTGDPDVLIVGDLNSYAKEDPITAFVNAGYTDLVNQTVGSAGYSYGFDGMAGYLDHALANPTLLAQTLAANEWHINSDEPDVLDYNTEYKSTGPTGQVNTLYNADAYRSTDHDPVLVRLGLYPDRSDASAYGTAWHTGQGTPWRLGLIWSGDASVADGSDSSDDGVTRDYSESWNDGRGEVYVTVTGPIGQYACLNAWLDYSDGTPAHGESPDGQFNANEHVIDNRPIQPGAGQLVTWAMELDVLNSAATYNMRFRLVPAPDPDVQSCAGVTLAAGFAPDGGASPTGRADGGEVEDYAFNAGPLAVDLASFTAQANANGVTLAWETVNETDNAGFNVYRADSEAGEWTRLNAALLPAAAPGSSEGHAYTWTDETATPGAMVWYMLEDVALDGTATRHAPVAVTPAEPNALGLAAFSATTAAGPGALQLAGLALASLAVIAGGGGRRRLVR